MPPAGLVVLFPVAMVGLMLVGFAVGSPLELEPFWVSGAAAAVLVGWGRAAGAG